MDGGRHGSRAMTTISVGSLPEERVFLV